MIKGSLMLHLGPIWYHSEPSDVLYSQNLPRPVSWFGLFLQQNDSSNFTVIKDFQLTIYMTKSIFVIRIRKCLKILYILYYIVDHHVELIPTKMGNRFRRPTHIIKSTCKEGMNVREGNQGKFKLLGNFLCEHSLENVRGK